jgi:hypothetical protein
VPLLIELVPGLPVVPVLAEDPLVLLFCANARELDNASAAAKPMVASFTVLSFI